MQGSVDDDEKLGTIVLATTPRGVEDDDVKDEEMKTMMFRKHRDRDVEDEKKLKDKDDDEKKLRDRDFEDEKNLKDKIDDEDKLRDRRGKHDRK